MATIVKTNTLLVSPPAEGLHVIRGMATVAIERGDPVDIDGSVDPRPRFDSAFTVATGVTCVGIALMTVRANAMLEIAVTGEIDGYTGLTPGQPVSVVGGKLDTTAPAGPVQMRALSPTRIMKTF
jgi:hypothetical protein